MALAEVETPALLVERPVMDANIAGLAAYLAERAPGIRLRPHAKTHKSPDIALRQVAAGAVGVCCQTVEEVEAMAAAGIADILLSNQIASAGKARRLAEAASVSRVSACVDDATQVRLLSEAAQARGVTLHVLVELDVGGARCGVGSSEAAAVLAVMIAESPGLSFDGLQAYHGRAQHLRSPAERKAAIDNACRLAEDAVAVIRQAGLSCRSVTGAGTGSFILEAASTIYTELQCGSYVFMDADYSRNQPDEAAAGAPVFAQSLTVLATVISKPAPDRAICDAGLKAMSLDSGPPSLARYPGVEFAGSSDEHSKLRLAEGADLEIGDRVHFIPGHCDPTVAMHDWILAHDGQFVTDVWPIARGW